ncbi:putative BTB/POZ domain-containing protein At3g08660 [Andrographis paniculata]|uniref:putative BTB/POZ domain-containing protein At3g08660 n=1 Tax=Andrographis paniculata TaxID=175694 RepID=UPI0021E76443|nr:putative BTB/POZ domain-containing protein At3g08660 [Andrographis paniculata]
MVWEPSLPSFTPHHQHPSATRTPKFSTSFANRIFSDVAGDITIFVDGESFLLHKFPLVARSGKIRKLVVDAKNTHLSKLQLTGFPGGPETFELAAKFCYGVNFEITPTNLAPLRCAAEYLEMTEDYHEQSLVQRTETYLSEVVSPSLEKSIEVLSVCEKLQPLADDIGIPDACIASIARNAFQEQLVSSQSGLGCNLKDRCLEWWIEDLSVLGIEFYYRVIRAMEHSAVRTDSIVVSLMHYAQTSLKGVGNPQIWNPARTDSSSLDDGQKVIMESLVTLLPAENSSSIPLSFLFGMLRVAIMVDASYACRLELEKRIAYRLETALLDDLLIPSAQTGGSLFDVGTIHRIMVHFLQRIEEEEVEEEEGSEECGYESEEIELGCPGHGSVLKVGRLMDSYLAEIAPDPYLSLAKFTAIIEVLPDYARVIDDGLYRAIDIYLKAHPMLNEEECKKLCKLIDCQKLSQEASNHAAQNDRLPVQMVVQVLYVEQLRLKSALSSPDGLVSQSQRMMTGSGVPSTGMSPRDTYACMRRENRELKLEISRMRVRLSELEREQAAMKKGQGVTAGGGSKSRLQGRTLLSSISTGIGRGIGIFINHSNNNNTKKEDGSTRATRPRKAGKS